MAEGLLKAYAARRALPSPWLSDARGELAAARRLPTFVAGGRTLLRRRTRLRERGTVRRVWSPVFPPDRHAERVLGDLRGG